MTYISDLNIRADIILNRTIVTLIICNWRGRLLIVVFILDCACWKAMLATVTLEIVKCQTTLLFHQIPSNKYL